VADEEHKLYGIFQDVMIAVMETEEGFLLPREFTVRLEPDAIRELMKGLTYVGTTTPVDPSHSEVLLQIFGHKIRVQSDDLPQPVVLH